MKRSSSEQFLDEWHEKALQTADSVILQTHKETLPVVSGIVAFGSTLAVATFSQLKLLGVSTGTRPLLIPSTLGAMSVCAASWASHHVTVRSFQSLEQYKRQHYLQSYNHNESISTVFFRQRRKLPKQVQQYLPTMTENNESNPLRAARQTNTHQKVNLGGTTFQIPMHTLRVCCLGLLAFRICGGRFWTVAPSSYTHIGSFARASLPANEQYATATQRKILERMGRFGGCHTCGSHRLWPSSLTPFKHTASSSSATAATFVGDHMPPRSVAKQINARWYNRLLRRQVKFRFYPQCTKCSNIQGSLLSQAVQQQNQLQQRSAFSFPPRPRPRPQQSLSKAGAGRQAHFHGLRPRLSHIIAGGTVAAATIVGASNEEIGRGNPDRFYQWQRRIEEWVQQKRRQILE